MFCLKDELETGKAGRNLDKDIDFAEYRALYGKYVRLANATLLRYRYVTQSNGTDLIPHIQQLLRKTTDFKTQASLREMEQLHIGIWKDLENVIDDIKANTYVQGRLPRTILLDDKTLDVHPGDLERVDESLYALIRP